MGAAKWCGHDSWGNVIPYDDVPKIADRYLEFKNNHGVPYERFGFEQNISDINNNILIPKYYDPDTVNELQSSAKTHDLVRLGELVETAIVTISTGVEIGRLNYGTGVIPFIRTSDMSKWELMIDPKHGVSGEIYKHYSDRNKVMEHDILMVRDGTYLVGTSCMLTKYHTKILFQSHIFRIRVTDPTELSFFLLLALINSPLVKRQIRS